MDPLDDDLPATLALANDYALRFLEGLAQRSVNGHPVVDLPLTLPEQGIGGLQAIRLLEQRFDAGFSAGPGPRYWGFVTGGGTPAALAADWVTSTVDQNALQTGDTCAPDIEQEACEMLRTLLGLPPVFTGLCVTGATQANYVGLAICLQLLGTRRDVDVAEQGVAAFPQAPRILSGAIHSSGVKAAAMLGLGRASVETLPLEPGRERVDTAALRERLRALRNTPVILLANAGTVNTVDFDDLQTLTALAAEHGAAVHVDGAFGLFARLLPETAERLVGLEGADTVAGDAHKWLNVPYDCGFVFTRHIKQQVEFFKNTAPYLPSPAPDPRNTLHLGPENSRRLRALPVWATLMAYGRKGHESIVRRCVELAQLLAVRLDREPRFQVCAPVRLNVVCFRPCGTNGERLESTQIKAYVERVLRDGCVRVTSSMLDGQPIIRAAFVNWRTQAEDVEVAFQALTAALP